MRHVALHILEQPLHLVYYFLSRFLGYFVPGEAPQFQVIKFIKEAALGAAFLVLVLDHKVLEAFILNALEEQLALHLVPQHRPLFRELLDL